jgi:short-subunit dehydrogenase
MPDQKYVSTEPPPVISEQVALVTGASAGIGRAYCEWLARAGASVVAVARREGRLLELQEQLERKYGTRVIPIVCDLSRPDSMEVIQAALQTAELDIDILINNAGYGVPGKYLANDWSRHQDSHQVMTTAIASLCYAFLPGMVARGTGIIINIASVAGFLPGTSGHTLYAATKAWLINFSESLAFEYEAEGIRVCAVCPGFTYSEFHDVTGTRELVSRLPKWVWMTAEQVVAQSFRALNRGNVVFIPGAVNRIIVRVSRILPRRLLHTLARRESRRFRNEFDSEP